MRDHLQQRRNTFPTDGIDIEVCICFVAVHAALGLASLSAEQDFVGGGRRMQGLDRGGSGVSVHGVFPLGHFFASSGLGMGVGGVRIGGGGPDARAIRRQCY